MGQHRGRHAGGRGYVGRHRSAPTPGGFAGKAMIAGVGVTALTLPLTAGTAGASVYDVGVTSRVSVGTFGQVRGVDPSLNIASDLDLSGSGRYASWVSQSPRLVARDTNGTAPDVFVRDRLTGRTYLVSLDTAGRQAPVFSGDGEDFVAANPVLASDAPYIAYVFRARQAHDYDRPFLRNLKTGATVELPHLDNFTTLLDLSRGGRYLLMKTEDEQFPGSQLWVYDAVTRQVTRLGLLDDAEFASGVISDDGRYVAYGVGGGSVQQNQIFRIDRTRPGTFPVPVSVAPGGVAANGPSAQPSMSADGRYVAFQSSATNLVRGDTNTVTDVFVRDLVARTTQRVSVGAGGRQGNGPSYPASISADGRQVAYTSAATNLVAGDTNRHTDVFVRQLPVQLTRRVSVGTTGWQLDRGAAAPVLSADGKHIGFVTRAAMVAADTNGLPDAYVRDVIPPR